MGLVLLAGLGSSQPACPRTASSAGRAPEQQNLLYVYSDEILTAQSNVLADLFVLPTAVSCVIFKSLQGSGGEGGGCLNYCRENKSGESRCKCRETRQPNYSSLSHPANKAINSDLREQTAYSEALVRGIAGFWVCGMVAAIPTAEAPSQMM